LYVDNQVVSSLRPPYGPSNEPIVIGHNVDWPERNWIGSIDDIVLWDRPLSPIEVDALYVGDKHIRQKCFFPERVPPPPATPAPTPM
jgi:hypothetical protein